jgi:hypothetical protein
MSAKFTSNDYKKLHDLRRLGNSGVLSENPRVRSSILRLGTSIRGLQVIACNPFFVLARFVPRLSHTLKTNRSLSWTPNPFQSEEPIPITDT